MTKSYTLEQLWKDLSIPVPINAARGLAIDLTLKLTDTSSTASAYGVADSKEDAFTRLRANPPFINGKANKENVIPVLKALYSYQDAPPTNPVFSAVSVLVDTIKTTQKQLDALDYTTPASDEGIVLFSLGINELSKAILRATAPLVVLEETIKTKAELFHNISVVDKEIEEAQTKRALLLGNHVPVKALKAISVPEPAPKKENSGPFYSILYTHLPFQGTPDAKFYALTRSICQRFYTHVWSKLSKERKELVTSSKFPGIQSYVARVLMDAFFTAHDLPKGFYSDYAIETISKDVGEFLKADHDLLILNLADSVNAMGLFDGFVDLPEHIRQYGLFLIATHPIDFTKSRFFPQFKGTGGVKDWDKPTTYSFWVSFFERFGSEVKKDEDPTVTFQRSVFAKEMGRFFLQLPSTGHS
jgi:hypothetical protein